MGAENLEEFYKGIGALKNARVEYDLKIGGKKLFVEGPVGISSISTDVSLDNMKGYCSIDVWMGSEMGYNDYITKLVLNKELILAITIKDEGSKETFVENALIFRGLVSKIDLSFINGNSKKYKIRITAEDCREILRHKYVSYEATEKKGKDDKNANEGTLYGLVNEKLKGIEFTSDDKSIKVQVDNNLDKGSGCASVTDISAMEDATFFDTLKALSGYGLLFYPEFDAEGDMKLCITDLEKIGSSINKSVVKLTEAEWNSYVKSSALAADTYRQLFQLIGKDKNDSKNDIKVNFMESNDEKIIKPIKDVITFKNKDNEKADELLSMNCDSAFIDDFKAEENGSYVFGMGKVYPAPTGVGEQPIGDKTLKSILRINTFGSVSGTFKTRLCPFYKVGQKIEINNGYYKFECLIVSVKHYIDSGGQEWGSPTCYTECGYALLATLLKGGN